MGSSGFSVHSNGMDILLVRLSIGQYWHIYASSTVLTVVRMIW